MASIPAGRWLSGEQRVQARNDEPFWIDIAPVSVEEFLPLAAQFEREGLTDASVLLNDAANEAGIETTG